MEKDKIIKPAKPEYFECFYEEYDEETHTDVKKRYPDSDQEDAYKERHNEYTRDLIMPKKICQCCGKEIVLPTPTNRIMKAKNDATHICSDCEHQKNADAGHRSIQYNLKHNRKNGLIGGLVFSLIIFGILFIIAMVDRSSTKSLLIACPIVFYCVFSYFYCLIGKADPVHHIFVDGFKWCGENIGKPFGLAGGFGKVRSTKEAEGLIIFAVIGFVFIVAFFAIVIAGILAISFIVSIFITPFVFAKRYTED